MLSKIRDIVSHGLGLDLWAEQGEGLLQRRKAALSQFLTKLETPNPRPRKPTKAVKRKAIFQPGDCLAVRLEDGDWGAILVLDGEPESDDPYKETYGTNLVVTLRYKSPEMPSLSVFEKREWLYLNHHAWKNYLELCYVTAARFKKVRTASSAWGPFSFDQLTRKQQRRTRHGPTSLTTCTRRIDGIAVFATDCVCKV